MTSIKTAQQQEDFQNLVDGFISNLNQKISKNYPYNHTNIDSQVIKYNFNCFEIRYSKKLEQELITELENHFDIEKENYELTFGQKTKENYKYKIKRKAE